MSTNTPQDKDAKARGRIRLSLCLLLIAALVLLFCAVPLQKRLVLSDARRGVTLLTLPLAPGETFALRFTHSVNLSDVTDTLEWTGDALILRSSQFTAFGAGIPVPAEGIGTALVNTSNGFLLTGIDTVQEDNAFLIMLQQVPDHRLLYRQREISLLELAGSGALLRLCVRPVSIFEIILYT